MRISGKDELLNLLCYKSVLDLATMDSSDEEDEVLCTFLTSAEIIIRSRRSSHLSVPKSTEWVQRILPCLDDQRMRQMLRIGVTEFDYILGLIKDDPVFENKNKVKQLPIQLQLEIALFRLGSSGESASLRKVASLFGVGDGGTVIIVTKRIIAALVNMRNKYLFWPTPSERRAITTKTMDELPGCIGYVDGTEIKLSEAPAYNHEIYFSRKKQYSLKMQVICDYSLRIRQATIGWPCSVHDAKIFMQCPIGRMPEQFFSEKQWIAGDSAYRLSSTLITPFRQNSNEFTQENRDKFNKYFSKYRVRVENCFGRLKEIFASLKELRFRLINEDNYNDCCDWILAVGILHNILLDFHQPTQIETYNENESRYPLEVERNGNLRGGLIDFINNKYFS